MRALTRDHVGALSQPHDRRALSGIGRHARLELVFVRRDGRTVIAHAYAEPPFRIGPSFQIGSAAYLIVVCAGPGAFAGDVLEQSVRVESGARVLLGSQAALQVHPGTASTGARLHHRYTVAADGELHCEWDPVIPFSAARLTQCVELMVSSTSRLYWSDALMSGRSARGENWRFSELAHELSLSVDGSLKYLERYRLAPDERVMTSPVVAGDASHMGTALVHHDGATAAAAESLQQHIDRIDGVRAGVDAVEPKVIVARVMARRGARFRAARTAFRQAVLRDLFAAPDLEFRR